MKHTKTNRILTACLASALLLASCASPVGTGDDPAVETGTLTAPIPLAAAAKDPVGAEADARVTDAVTAFSERFYKEAAKNAEGNMVLSPLSLYYALSLTANGALGDTKADFEKALGMDTDALNEYLYTLTNNLAATENSTVDIANSVWGNEGAFTLSPDFQKIAENYYAAEAESLPFDAEALARINGWVNDKTDGMIPTLLDELDPGAVMVLLNAVLFDGVWQEEYEEDDIAEGTFTTPGGDVRADFLYSTEYGYFETPGGVGFSKPYKDGYRFVAVLPDGGAEAYVASMDLDGILKAAYGSSRKCEVSIPKFEYETSLGLNSAVESLGLGRIFTEQAELGGLSASGQNDLAVSSILQKAKIILNEHGTKAAAATGMVFNTTAFMPDPTPTVYLDHPFLFVIADPAGIPLFIGTVENPAE